MSKGAMKVAIALIQENDDLIVIDDTDEDWWQVKLLRGLKQAGADISRADEDAERRRADEQEREMERAQAQRMAEERRRQDEEDRRRRVAAEEERQRRQKEEEERRRKEREESNGECSEQSKPSLPSRPAENARSPVSTSSYRPPMPQRAPENIVFHQLFRVFQVSRPATSSRPKSQGEDGKGKGPLEKPNETKIRTWTDRSGSFKVDAEFLNVAEGKVHLHKTNGVKIAVPVEKLSPEDLDYVRRVTGNGSLGTGSSAPKPRQGVSAATLASAAAAGVPPPPSSSYVYNGFDWRDWLLKAGVSTGDALIYAQAFVNERMDKSVLDDIDRDVAFMGGNANAAAIAERERLARANNMAMLGRSVTAFN
ncbi:SLA1 homology domain 1, SHD1-domain-containing protein [Chytridium lagenaria]|nr:SLA1 homology domain 1, SHD1-domain-containing protein [Chytridium lagenaria]